MLETALSPDSTVLGFDVGSRRIGVAIGSAFSVGARALAMVDVRADGAHPIGAEGHVVRGLVIGFKKNSFAAHAFPLFIQFC